jgi:hypothetical protein
MRWMLSKNRHIWVLLSVICLKLNLLLIKLKKNLCFVKFQKLYSIHIGIIHLNIQTFSWFPNEVIYMYEYETTIRKQCGDSYWTFVEKNDWRSSSIR